MDSDHKQINATPQTQLGHESKKPEIQTDLDHPTVDYQQRKSCEMESDHHHIITTPTLPSESTNAPNATATTNNTPNFTTEIINSLPVLCQLAEDPGTDQILRNPITLSRILKYMLYIEIKRCTASNEFNGDIFPDSQDDASLYSGTNFQCWHEAHKEIIDELVQVVFSDAALLRHFKEKGESIDRAIAEMRRHNTAHRDQSPSEFSSLDKALDEYASPILNMFIARVNDADYDSSDSSSDGSVDIAPEVATEGIIAPELVDIEHTEDRREIGSESALLSSGSDLIT